MTSVQAVLVTRSPQRLAADPSRVITRLFVPGREGFEREDSRAGAVLARILALDDNEVRSSLDDVVTRFDGRHRDLVAPSAGTPANSPIVLDPDSALSDARMLLLGAAFTSEYAIEGAALCNPSIVAHPDQAGTAAGQPAIRDERPGIGKGTAPQSGSAPASSTQRAAPPSTTRLRSPSEQPGPLLEAAMFRIELARLDAAGEAADYVLDALDDRFTRADLDEQLDKLQTHLSTRGHAHETIS